jgi:hypothetical protein
VQGLADAQYYLGFMSARGNGLAKDQAEAASWYRRSAGQGFARALPEWKRASRRAAWTLILDHPANHPAGTAHILMSVDGEAERWTVRLPDGIQPTRSKVPISSIYPAFKAKRKPTEALVRSALERWRHCCLQSRYRNSLLLTSN